MALGTSTFSDIGGAVSDIFAGLGAQTQADLKAQGLQITAQGTRISAESTDLSAEGLDIKAQGDIAEAQNYDLAASLARQNESFTDFSTRVQLAQTSRAETQAIGGARAAVGAAGFTGGGSALDIMRDSASQGALQKGVLSMQGAINEAGYNEQAAAYTTLANTGRATAAGEEDIATQTRGIATQQLGIANQQDQLAVETQQAGQQAATGDFISSAIKGAAAIATLI